MEQTEVSIKFFCIGQKNVSRVLGDVPLTRCICLTNAYLVGEIKSYGYSFSVSKMLMFFLIAALFVLLSGFAFKLPMSSILIIFIFTELIMSAAFCNWHRIEYEQKRFSDCSKYIEKMLMYFKANNKILLSLEDTLKMFPDGDMHDVIERAIEYIKFADSEINIEKTALHLIEEQYESKRVRLLHSFLLSVEQDGGDCSLGVEILLNDRNTWTERTAIFQKEKAVIRRDINIGFILSTLICLLFVWMPELANTSLLDVQSFPLVIGITTIYLLLIVIMYYKADRSMCTNWLDDMESHTDEYWRKEYDSFIHFDMKRERNHSILYFAIGMLCTIGIIVLQGGIHNFTGLLLPFATCLISIFLLFFYKLKYRSIYGILKKDIEKNYPGWIIHVALLLQKENVQQSLFQSYENAPGSIKPALQEMLKRLNVVPDDINAFNGFLHEFNIAELQETMDTLYGIVVGSGGDIQLELKNLLKRNAKMIDRAEEIKNNDRKAYYSLYVSGTTLLSSFMLIVYMGCMMLSFLSLNIGS